MTAVAVSTTILTMLTILGILIRGLRRLFRWGREVLVHLRTLSTMPADVSAIRAGMTVLESRVATLERKRLW